MFGVSWPSLTGGLIYVVIPGNERDLGMVAQNFHPLNWKRSFFEKFEVVYFVEAPENSFLFFWVRRKAFRICFNLKIDMYSQNRLQKSF